MSNDTQYPMEKRLVATAVTRKLAEVIIKKTHGLPEGAKVVDSFEDAWTRNLILVWQHESFPEVAEGCQIPLRDLELKPGESL